MAFASVGIIGTSQSSTADQSSFVMTTTNTLEAGNLGVICIGCDNNQTTDGDEGAVTGVVDSAGNTWSKAHEHTNGQGAAKAGATVGMWYVVAGAQLTGGGTITVSLSNNTSRDKTCATAFEYTIGAGKTVQVEATNQLATDGAAMGDLDAVTANIECLRIHAVCSEDTGASIMSPTGFTNWQTPTITSVTTGGGAAANQGVRAAHLISTSQDYWFWVLVTKGLTPIPFKIVTIMSGFLHFDIWKFTIGMVVSRVTFFMMIAVALRFYGDDIRIFIEKHLPMTALALLVVVVGGFFVLPMVL